VTKSASYKPCGCGSDCYLLDADDNEPCWGKVDPSGISGDDDFCHACQGHYAKACGDSEYQPEGENNA
jgi:hypothetical protein